MEVHVKQLVDFFYTSYTSFSYKSILLSIFFLFLVAILYACVLGFICSPCRRKSREIKLYSKNSMDDLTVDIEKKQSKSRRRSILEV